MRVDPKKKAIDANPELSPHGGVDWELRQNTPVRKFLNSLEKLSLALEKPVNKIAGNPVFNPLYHTGTITTFLLLIILVTGAYLTFFYQFGFDSSYQAVSSIEANFVGRIMRAMHRYASGAVVFTALLHGWRTFFQDRFRGPRWLAWISGIGMAAMVWFIGITGYWLIWDERAEIFNQILFDLLEDSRVGVSFLLNTLVSDQASTGWVFILTVITLHLGLSVVVGLFYWWHIKRLNRPKLLPPQHWMVLAGGLLLIISLLIPLGMLPQASQDQVPVKMPLDLFYLFYLPIALNVNPWIFWSGVIILIGSSTSVPWLLRRKPLSPIQVSKERCTGCTLCEVDCPYKAIRMIARKDESSYKSLAEIDPNLCVSCGVCIGSCPTMALTLGEIPAELLWEEVITRAKREVDDPLKIVFTCERHAYQGAKPFLSDPDSKVIPVPCVGMIHPDLIVRTFTAGASEIQVVGCPPEDCANREGNRHLQERIDGARKPVLRSKYENVPISTDWVPPNEFMEALDRDMHQSIATTYHQNFDRRSLFRFIPIFVILAILSLLVVLANNVPYRPEISQHAIVQVVMDHRPGFPLLNIETNLEPAANIQADTRLVLEIDGLPVLDEVYLSRGKEDRSKIFERYQLPPGEYQIKLLMMDRGDSNLSQIIWDKDVNLDAGQILNLRFTDESIGNDPAAGEKLYYESSLGTNASCRICHSLEPGEDLVGPSFAGIASRAENRIPGLSAEEYLRQSILEPDAYIVEGYPSGLMVPNLGETLTDAQIDDLVAFLMTLK